MPWERTTPRSSPISNKRCWRPFWSPDGATIYYTYSPTDGGGLWAVGASGGTPEPVLDHATGASIHPDGRTFAFVRERKLGLVFSKEGRRRRWDKRHSPPTP